MNRWWRDTKRWEQIGTDEEYAYLRNLLSEKYEDLKNTEFPQLTFSLFINGIKTGDRHTYESVYFKRREFLNVYTLLSLVYPKNDEYLSRLEDIICSILFSSENKKLYKCYKCVSKYYCSSVFYKF